MRTWLAVLAVTAALGGGTALAGPGDAGGRARVAAARALDGKAVRLNARGEPRVAQVPTRVDLAIATVARAQRSHAALVAERATATRRYEAELAEIDGLKRQKASWRRDRALRAKLAASLETARLLTALADRVRGAELDVQRSKAAAVAAIDAALPAATGVKKSDLLRRRAAWAAPARVKKIILPDGALDPLADPEELEEQAAAIAEAEAALAAEIGRIEKRVARFERMADLRGEHERAESMGRNDDEVRRVAARGGIEGDHAPTGAPPFEDGSGLSEGPGGRELATVLSDVVDAGTVDALRLSDRSSDPSAWAAASRQARDAVAGRLETLRKQRAAIEARARQLRKP